MRTNFALPVVLASILTTSSGAGFAQTPAAAPGAAPAAARGANPNGVFQQAAGFADTRPGLLFREDFRENPLTEPLTADQVTNPNLAFTTYGPGKDQIRKSHHDTPKDDPYYIFTGSCTLNCAFTLHDKNNLVDLSGFSKIRWRTKQSGLHRLHVLLKLADGKWMISEYAVPISADWQVTEMSLYGLRWLGFDPVLVHETVEPVEKPDLSRVDEIGFTDLMTGTGSAEIGASRVDWIEVYGRSVKR